MADQNEKNDDIEMTMPDDVAGNESDFEQTMAENEPTGGDTDLDVTLAENENTGVDTDIDVTLAENQPKIDAFNSPPGTDGMAPHGINERQARAPTKNIQGIVSKETRIHVEPVEDRWIPEKLGKFEVKKILGSGGMGDVFLGRHPTLDIPIAIKTIKGVHAQKRVFVDRFIREAKLATKINHQNAVRIYDVDQDDDIHFIVQEYVDGNDLQKVLEEADNHKLDIDNALDIVIGITRALVEAEKLNIVHRDIKPSNIMITKDGIPKLVDLGLAKETSTGNSDDSEIHETQSGTSLGSPAYMAPEQVLDAKTVDIRADIYALGVTFFYIVTNKLPFKGATTQEMIMKKIHEHPSNPAQSHPELPRQLTELLDKMMEKDPDKRYQSPNELLIALEELRHPPQSKNGLLAAVAMLSVLVIVLSYFYFQSPKMQHDPIIDLNNLLAAEKFTEAQSYIAQINDEANPYLVYAKGLCYLKLNDDENVIKTISELKALTNGSEAAVHLEILNLIESNQLADALKLIESTLPDASHKLPLLDSKSSILQKQGNHDDARQSLQTALNEASFFSFQKLHVFDNLANMLASSGKFDEARNLYEKAMTTDDAEFANASIHTNYAVTLMNGGNNSEAVKQVNQALTINPKDKIALHLMQKLDEQVQQQKLNVIKETMSMIDDVNQNVRDSNRTIDRWTSTPVILTFLPLETTSTSLDRLGAEELWGDDMVKIIRESIQFPIVDRDTLNEILRELKLNTSDLSSANAQLQLGRILPASVLVKGSLTKRDTKMDINLRLIDVQTSEIVAVIKEKIEDTDHVKLFTALSEKLNKTLHNQFPVKGRVKTIDENVYEINIGKYHGLAENQVINIYASVKYVSPLMMARKSPIVQGKISGLDKFTAIIEADINNSKEVTPEMLVMAPMKK